MDPRPLTIPWIDALALERGPEMISFAGGTPHPSDLPLEQLARAMNQAVSRDTLSYGASRGHPALLEALEGFFATEGLNASADRTMITSGAMAGIDLVFRHHLKLGDVVIVEAPTYSDSLISLQLSGARIVELPMDHDGAIVEELPRIAAEAPVPPKLIYVIPTFHNPTGVTLSAARREQLVSVARELGAVLVEDDAYAPFRFEGEELPSLAALDPGVIAIRSLSKIVAPGLRVGAVVGPPEVVDQLVHLRGGVDICTNVVAQEAVASFISSGEIHPHVDGLTKLFAGRREAMLEALATSFRDVGAEWTVPQGGMFIWVQLPEGFDTVALLEPALAADVAFVPGSVFSARPEHRRALRLCFAGADPDRIAVGVQRLRSALDAARADGER